MLHRVAPYEPGNLIYNENMKISPDELERIIQELIENEVNFISLDQISKRTKPDRVDNKFVVFTLDDGYLDNLNYAYPIFKKYNVPFCIYVTNSFPNKSTNLWWYALEKLILQNNYLTFSGKKRSNLTDRQKRKNFLAIRRQIIDKNFYEPIQFIKGLGSLDFDLSQEIVDKCLSWQQIVDLSKDPLVTIGCHTMNHYPLSKIQVDEVIPEILNSKKEIETKIGKEVRHFAFPFGTRHEAGPREYKRAGELGFETVATAIHGHVQMNQNLRMLNRIFLSPLQKNGTTLSRVMYWNLKSYYFFLRTAILG